jgi:restriction endonuclease
LNPNLANNATLPPVIVYLKLFITTTPIIIVDEPQRNERKRNERKRNDS